MCPLESFSADNHDPTDTRFRCLTLIINFSWAAVTFRSLARSALEIWGTHCVPSDEEPNSTKSVVPPPNTSTGPPGGTPGGEANCLRPLWKSSPCCTLSTPCAEIANRFCGISCAPKTLAHSTEKSRGGSIAENFRSNQSNGCHEGPVVVSSLAGLFQFENLFQRASVTSLWYIYMKPVIDRHTPRTVVDFKPLGKIDNLLESTWVKNE